MSFTKSEKKDTNKYEIEFLIEKKDFDAATDAVFKKKIKSFNIPGFRKGHAPRAMVEKMYGKGVFYEDAINDCLPTAYDDAEKQSGLTVVSRPDFEVVSIDDDGVHMTAVVFTKPEVAVKDYKGIKAEKNIHEVKDEDVDHEIAAAQERNSRMTDITDRAAENGDIVNIDFDGYTDGKQFEGGKAEKYDLTLGSGQFIPGFEEQIIGKNIGDEFDVNVTFPEEYGEKTLAGKPAVFKVKLHSIKKKELPALDDDFAKDVSEFDTFDAYKADVKAKIAERNDKAADNDVEDQLINQLIENLEAEIPDAMFETETENFVRDYDNRLRMQGLDLSQYFKYTGQTLEDLRKQMRPQAEKQVKTRLSLEKIAEIESIKPTDEEIEEEYKKIAEQYGMETEKVKELVDKAGISADIAVRKAVDFVKANAVIKTKTVKDDEKAEKPAKKETAKKTAAKKPAAKTEEKAD